MADTENKPGHEYLAKLAVAKAEIKEAIERVQTFGDLIPEEDENIAADLKGKLDHAVGSANLLINGKCKQFEKLCEKNIAEDGDEQFPTKDEDLAGFWDLVSISIDNVKAGLLAMEKLKDNDWKDDNSTNKKQKKARAQNADSQRLKKKPLSNKNENSAAIAKKSEESRKRLLEFKKAQLAKLSSGSQNNGESNGGKIGAQEEKCIEIPITSS